MPNNIYVESANTAFTRACKNYERLMQSILEYPEPNHENFKVEVFRPSEEASNTHLLFIYGHKVYINLTLVFKCSNEYFGKVSCRLDNEILTELYINSHGDLLNDVEAIYPEGYLGPSGDHHTAMKFLTTIAQQVLK